MHDYNNNGISDKEDLIIMETDDEENISNGAKNMFIDDQFVEKSFN